MTTKGSAIKGLFIRRIVNAGRHSWQGLQAGWRSEEALRVELLATIVLLPVALYLDITTPERALLIITLGLVLITELLNSAVEAVVDRVGEEFHELSGKAKDLGSAAVLMSLLVAGLVWVMILFF